MHIDQLLRPAPLSRRFVVAVLAISFVVVLIMAFQARHRVYQRMLVGSHEGVNDFQRWMHLTPAFLAGKAGYVNQDLSTPPVTLLIFAPFSRMAPHNAQFAWAMCKWLFAGGIVYSCWRMIRGAGLRVSPVAATLAIAVWMWPVFIDIAEGQTNLLMLFPLTAGLCLAQNGGRAARVTAGILIALAICIKVTPLIFLIYMLWRRRGWEVLGIGLGLGLWLWLVPGLAFGWEQNARWLVEYFNLMIAPYVAHGTVKYYFGQSLPSFLTRLLRHVPAFDVNGLPPIYVNFVDLPEKVSNLIVRGALGTLALAGLWWMRRPLPSLKCPRYVIEIGCVAVFMVWASQQSWVPHYVSMALALAGAAMVLSNPEESPESRRLVLRALLISFGFMLMTSDAGKIFGPDGGEYIRTLGVSIWSCLLLIAATITSRCGRPDYAPVSATPEGTAL